MYDADRGRAQASVDVCSTAVSACKARCRMVGNDPRGTWKVRLQILVSQIDGGNGTIQIEAAEAHGIQRFTKG